MSTKCQVANRQETVIGPLRRREGKLPELLALLIKKVSFFVFVFFFLCV